MSVTTFLNNRGLNIVEGYCEQIPGQVKDLIEILTNNKQIINVLEIGFNAGHSAELFLQNNKDIKLVSFDLGMHDYVLPAKEYIDLTYPNRHVLVLGDSRETIPRFIKDNKGLIFDIIFIDGGHDYEIAKSDLENCLHLAHKDTIVIIDDTMFIPKWMHTFNIGPTRSWSEFLEQNKVVELNRKDYCSGRGMCWGKYVFE